MKTMMRKIALGMVAGMIAMLIFSALPIVDASNWTDTVPVMDGIGNTTEYTGSVYTMYENLTGDGGANETIYVDMVNDDDYLYVYMDILPQNESFFDYQGNESFIGISIDVNRDGYINHTYEPTLYIEYYGEPSPEFYVYSENNWFCRDFGSFGIWGLALDETISNYSVRGVDANYTYNTSENNDTIHFQVELRIPMVWDNHYDMVENESIDFLIYGWQESLPIGVTSSWVESYNGNTTYSLVNGLTYTIGIDPFIVDLNTPSEPGSGDEQINLEDDVPDTLHAVDGEDSEDDGDEESFFGTALGIIVVAGIVGLIIGGTALSYWWFFVRK